MLDEYLSDRPFFQIAPYCGLWPNATLATLSGIPSGHGPHETDLIRAIEEAWATPLKELTCEQVRRLLGQRCGLQWLGMPILTFVRNQPEATVTNYPGEMALLSLNAVEDMLAAASEEFRTWLRGDFSWFEEVFGWDKELLARARDALQQARDVAGL